MSGTIRISLRAGERIYINGAVIRVDRKTTLELLNDVVFLLEQHVMQPEEATTPFRRLYFCVQKMLIDPAQGVSARQEFYQLYLELLVRHENDAQVIGVLDAAKELVNAGRSFEALKRIRTLCEAEDAAGGRQRQTDQSSQARASGAKRRVRSRRARRQVINTVQEASS